MNPFQTLPKVELHLHLDCSLSFDVVRRIKPEVSWEEYSHGAIAPTKCPNLAAYIAKADFQINLMQQKNHLEWVVDDLFRQLKADSVIYAEVRFAPLEHTKNGLKPEEVIEIVSAEMERSFHIYGIYNGLILCTLRHYNEQQSMQVAKLVERYVGQSRVVGFDIAADEANFSIDSHIKAFQYVYEKGIPATAHAGEAKGADSVWETLEQFKVKRLGHGVRSIEDQALLDYLTEHQVYLEVCPTSNVQTNTVPTYDNHPIQKLRDAGISVGVNTDGRTISNISLSEEYLKLNKYFGWSEKDFELANLSAIEVAFCDSHIKQRVWAILNRK